MSSSVTVREAKEKITQKFATQFHQLKPKNDVIN